MLKSFIGIGFAAFLAWTLASSAGSLQDTNRSNEAALRQLVADYAAAFSSGDSAKLATFWATDAEFIDEQGAATTGRTAIAARFKQGLAALKGYKMEIKIKNLKLFKGNVAIQDGVTILTAPDGTAEEGRFTALWTKTDGAWLLQNVRDLPNNAVGKVGSELAGLQWLVGSWSSDGGDIEMAVKPILSRAFLSVSYVMKSGDDKMEVLMLVGFDPLTSQIKSWTYDSQAGYGEALWMRDGNSWIADSVGVLAGGLTGESRNVIQYLNENQIVFKALERQVEGQPIPDSEVKLTRKSGK